MSMDLGDSPVGTAPSVAQQLQLRTSMGLDAIVPVVASASLGVASYELLQSTGAYQKITFSDVGGNRTLTAKVTSPEPADGSKLHIRVVTLASGGTLILSTGISIPSLSTTPWATTGFALAASKTYELLLRYNTDLNKWEFLSFTGGFA